MTGQERARQVDRTRVKNVPELLVYENYAHLSDADRQRHGIVGERPAERFTYKSMPPEELWRVKGKNGTMLSADFKSALDAFQMGGKHMVKIEIIVFDN